ncbi:MAG: methyltransferase domain-containing protein, partial [Pelobium sp.]
MRSDWHNKVEEVLFKVTEMIRNDGHQQDISYFKFHKDRYQRMALALEPKDEKKKSVLNIGSHYLHSTLIFQLLGFEVDSMDVDVFWNIDFVDARATHYQVNKIIENDLETLMSLKNIHDKYDIVLFTEILEHITFNPIAFWKKIYDSLKTDGIIYISTPNSLNLANVIRATIKIVTLRGIGTPLNEIFS